MPNALVFGDSTAGAPGAAAATALRANGYQVTVIHNDGKSPIVQTRAPYWAQYVNAARGADVVLLVFGSNSSASTAHRVALEKLRDGVRPPVLMSGPPIYNAERRPIGDALRAMNAQVFGSRYIDAYPHTSLSLPRAPDGVHLTAVGAVPWGTAMARGVMDFMADPSSHPRVGGAPRNPT